MSKKIILFFAITFISIIFGSNIIALNPKVLPDQGSASVYWGVAISMVSLLTDNTDTVIFGDSIAHGGYISKELGASVFNFALDGTTPIEGYFFLKYMVNNGKRPKNIVLTYNPQAWKRSWNFWDEELPLGVGVITRKEAKEILYIDQNNPPQSIGPYNDNNHTNNDSPHIPYYYDIAYGLLKHIKLDFERYVASFIGYHEMKSSLFSSRGHTNHQVANTTNGSWCVLPQSGEYVAPSGGVVQHYFKKLIELADEQKINVYVMDGPMPESCVSLGYQKPHISQINYLKRYKSIHLQHALPIAVPDNLMLNEDHVSQDGAVYFSQRVKPFFDEMGK